MTNYINKILAIIFSIGCLIITFGGSLIHLYTTYLYAVNEGFLSALWNFCIPIIAEIFCFFDSLARDGLSSFYCTIIISYIAAIIVTGLSLLGLKKE